MTKLTLIAKIASKYNDPVLDYFYSRGFYIEFFSAEECGGTEDGWSIASSRNYITNLYYTESFMEFNNTLEGDPEGLLGAVLAEDISRLCSELTPQNTSVLPELADLYTKIEEIYAKEQKEAEEFDKAVTQGYEESRHLHE